MINQNVVPSSFFERYDEIVRALYRAARGTGTWTAACGALADALGLWTLQILGVDPRSGALQFSWDGGTVPQQAWLEYFTTYHQINPRIPAAIRLPLNGWLHDHLQFPPSTFEKEPFFRDFMIPLGGRFSSSCKIIEGPELVVFLSAHRHSTRPPLSVSEIQALDRIRDHVVEAIDLYRVLQHGQNQTFVAKAMLDAIDQPVLLIDDLKTVHHANQSAYQTIESSGSLRIVSHSLRCLNSNDSDRFAYLIRELGLGAPAAESPRSRGVIRLGLEGAKPEFVVVAIAVRPEASAGVFGSLPRAILLVHPLIGHSRLEPFILTYAYDLTHAEAMVAVDIAEGLSPKDIAKRRSVSIWTVRAQLKVIFGKVGVTRQSELAKTLHQMPRKSLEADARRLVL